MDSGNFSDDLSSSSQGPYPEYRMLINEMKGQNLDVIRFASYRTACKLRFLQKRTNFYLVDIWNIIEAFRENGFNVVEPRMIIYPTKVEQLLTSIFVQLNKRLPSSQQIDHIQSSSLLLNWFLAAYDPDDSGQITVLSIKVALALMCSGKLTDKLRYIFSLISDKNGRMIYGRCADFLQETLSLPCSVLESPSFSYSEDLVTKLFDKPAKATLNDFLDTLLADPSPAILAWLPLLHRLANVENIFHPVQCDGCNREAFCGFRYKCQRCHNYQLCQDCFWRGRVSGAHSNQHEVKEYAEYKSASKQFGHSLRKSFRCVPEKPMNHIPRFPEAPENTLNLSHIVPPSPIPSHNGFLDHSFDMSSLDSRSSKSPYNSLDYSYRDDEHKLIARYAACLANSHLSMRTNKSKSVLVVETGRQKELISQLEVKNREIMREIITLRKQQEEATLHSEQNPTLMTELRGLRQRKDELEGHLTALQESRRELMVQLETLMKLLKNHQTTSPRSTPNSSPHSGTSKSPPYPLSSSRSAPTTPGSNAPTSESLSGVGCDVMGVYGQGASTRSLKNDLLVAADSVANAMSSLVRELNSDSEDESKSIGKISSSHGFETEDTESIGESLGGGINSNANMWRSVESNNDNENKFISEIEARNPSPENDQSKEEDDEELYDKNPRELLRRHQSFTTDDESYIRTDDEEEGSNTDWEENMKRWVNR